MRCRNVKKALEEGTFSEARIEAHLKECPACREAATEWRLLRRGFRTLAAEQPPEASWGFTERLQRRLAGAVQNAGDELMEIAGRRIIYVTLLITVFVLLGLVIPSSSPLRARGSAEVLGARPEMAQASQAAPIGLSALETVPSAPARPAAQGGLPHP